MVRDASRRNETRLSLRSGFFFSSLFFFNFTTRNKTQQAVTTTREINAYNNPRKCEMKKDLM